MNAVSNSEAEGIMKYLAQDSDLGRFYQIFGCDSLRLMLNSTPGQNVRISQVTQDGETAEALLCSPDLQRWSTVCLRKLDGTWQITDAFPVKSDDIDGLGQLPEELLDFIRGKTLLNVDCGDADLTRFLRAVYRQAREFLVCADSDYSGKVTSIFEMTEYLWTRKMLWGKLQKMRYDAAVYITTMNNDIYVGVEKHTSRRIAIKLLRNTKQRMREKFLNEINILDSLRQHSCVPTILFSGTVEGYPYFGSDWALGNPLEDELRKSPGWSIRERVQVMINIARAIRDLRTQNVIHRDVATDHVFVRDNFEISIIDFGMASFLHDLDPEKFRVAHRKEIRNFGLLACYLLVNDSQPLFGSAGKCINTWAASLDRLRATDISRELIRIVERAVAADPECRSITFNDKPPYEDIGELLIDIEHASGLL
ncbi:MAG TPA: protein kinase [Blastocatellia bacterium]|nr:protein kinase [Blastocatellia bacterium]